MPIPLKQLASIRPTLAKIPIHRRLLPYLCDYGTPALRRKVLEWFPDDRVQALVKAVDMIDAKCREILRDRKAALGRGDESVSHEIAEGKDILSVLRTSAAFQEILSCSRSP